MTEDHEIKAAVTAQRLTDHEKLCGHRFKAVQAVQEETNVKIDDLKAELDTKIGKMDKRQWAILFIVFATALGVAAKHVVD